MHNAVSGEDFLILAAILAAVVVAWIFADQETGR